MPDADMPVDLLPDGRVRLALDDKTVITLRRPLIGQLRALHEGLDQAQDDARDILANLPPAPPRPDMAALGDDEAAAEARRTDREQRREHREAERKVMAEHDDMRAGWMRTVCETLGDRPLPSVPTSDLPTWTVSAQVAVAMVNHWQSVPLGRGGR